MSDASYSTVDKKDDNEQKGCSCKYEEIQMHGKLTSNWYTNVSIKFLENLKPHPSELSNLEAFVTTVAVVLFLYPFQDCHRIDNEVIHSFKLQSLPHFVLQVLPWNNHHPRVKMQ